MPELDEYVKRLRALKSQSMTQYQQTMESYKASYPEFYNQLVKALEESSTASQGSNFKIFFNQYKWYLFFIGAGLITIGVLLFLLFTR